MFMALALGEGGEQNAPLGRAVIGGLLMATVVTLFVVPTVYTCCGVSRRPRTSWTASSQWSRGAAVGDAAR